MHCAYAYRPLKDGNEAAEAAAREFARASIFERVWLHAALEIPALRARAEPFAAYQGDRLIGLAVAIEGLFPFRVAALDALLPGVAAALLLRFEPPFVCQVPARLEREIGRAGGRPIRRDRQLVRFEPPAQAGPVDAQVERLSDPVELARFLGPAFAPLELELAPFLGIRDAFGDLAAVAGARFVTDRVGLVGHLETRDDCRRQGHALALASALSRALESPERRVVVHVPQGVPGAQHLFAELGFRGAHDFAVFAR